MLNFGLLGPIKGRGPSGLNANGGGISEQPIVGDLGISLEFPGHTDVPGSLDTDGMGSAISVAARRSRATA